MADFDGLDRYASETDLRKQTDFILSLFKEVEAGGAHMAEALKNAVTLFENKDTPTKKWVDGIKNLELTTANYQKILASLAPDLDNLTQAQKDNLKALNDQFKAEEIARAGAKETVKLIATEIGQSAKLEAARSETAKAIAKNAVELKRTNDLKKAEAEIAATEEGSIKRAEAVRRRLLLIQKDINVSTDEGAQKSENYKKKIDQLSEFIRKNSDSLTQQKINIGNYVGSAKIVVDALEKERSKLNELIATREKAVKVQQVTGFGRGNTPPTGNDSNPSASANTGAAGFKVVGDEAALATKNIAELDKEIAQSRTIVEGFSRVTENPKFLNIASKVGDAQAEVRFFTKSLIDLEAQGLGNSEAANQLRQNLAKLTDEIHDTKEEVKALSSDSRGFDLFAGSVSFAADAFQTFAGAAVLAGASEEDAAAATKTLVAVQSVANGVKGIAVELTTRGTAANKLFTFAQNQVSIALDTTAAAGARVKAVLATIGFGALVLTIGYLITNYSKIKDALSGVSKEQKILNDLNEKAIDGYVEESTKVKLLVTEYQALGTSQGRRKEIQDQLQKDYPAYFGNLKTETDFANGLSAAYEKLSRALVLKAKVTAASSLISENEAKALKLELEAQEINENRFGSGVFGGLVGKRSQKGIDKLKAEKLAEAKAIRDKNDFLVKTALEAQNELDKLSDKQGEDGLIEKLQKQIKKLQDLQPTLLSKDAIDNNIAEIKKLQDELDALLGKVDKDKTKQQSDRFKSEIENEKRINEAKKQLMIENANELIRINQKIVDDQNSTLPQKLAALSIIDDQKKKLALIELNSAVESEKKIENGKKVVTERANAEKVLALTIYNNQVSAINEETLAKQTAAQKQATEKTLSELESAINNVRETEQSAIDADLAEKLASLDKFKKQGIITEKEYSLAKDKFTNDSLILSLNSQKKELEGLRSIAALKGEELAKLDNEIKRINAEIESAQNKSGSGNDKPKGKGLTDEEKERADKLLEIEQSANKAVSALVDAKFEKEAANIQKLIDLNNEKKDVELKNISDSTLSAQEKFIQTSLAEKQAADRSKKLALEQLEIKRRQAKFDRDASIIQIGINTAVAFTKALPNYLLAGAVLASGLAEATAVLSKPLPTYGGGTDDHPGGVAIIGELFKPELVEEPGKGPVIVDKPTVYKNLAKHSKVTPLDDINHEMYSSMKHDMARQLMIGNNYVFIDNKNELKEIKEAVYETGYLTAQALKRQRVPIVNVYNDRAFNDYIQKVVRE